MIAATIATYGTVLIILGFVLLMCDNRPKRKEKKRKEELESLRRARQKRARVHYYIGHRTDYDTRVKRHSLAGGYYQ